MKEKKEKNRKIKYEEKKNKYKKRKWITNKDTDKKDDEETTIGSYCDSRIKLFFLTCMNRKKCETT